MKFLVNKCEIADFWFGNLFDLMKLFLYMESKETISFVSLCGNGNGLGCLGVVFYSYRLMSAFKLVLTMMDLNGNAKNQLV